MQIVVVGSVAYDSIKTATEDRKKQLGGSATYFSLAASRFTDINLVGVVGDDFLAEHVALLVDHGVNTEGLQTIDGGKTFHWAGVYSDDFVERETLDTQLNVFETFKPELNAAYRKSPILFLANIHPALQTGVLDQMDAPDFVACDTMNLWIDNNLDELKAVLKRVDLLTINDEEAFLISGERNIHAAAKAVQALGPKYLIIKRGEFGALLYGEGKVFILPAFPVQNVNDPTGAGDSFAGGMMGYLASKGTFDFQTIRQAIVVGTLVASFTVEDFSVNRLLDLDEKEIKNRQDQFGRMTGFEPFKMSLK